MADPIGGVNPIDVSGIASAGGPGSQPALAPKPATNPVPAVDSADLSRAAALLATISQAAAGVPSIDRERIGQLQEALNSGTYRADPQLIADKIMEIESLLSATNPE